MFIYCICTQYLVGAPFAFNLLPQFGVAWRWSVCGTAEVVRKPRFLWQWPSAHLHFLVSCFSFSSWQYPIDSLWGSGLMRCWPVKHTNHYGHLNQLLVLLAVWAGCQILLENEISIFKKLVSRRKHEVLQNLWQTVQWRWFSKKHNGPTTADDIAPRIITDCGNLTWTSCNWAMSFSTLPPDSRTLVSKWNTKLALIWKEDFWPLGKSPVLLLLSPGKIASDIVCGSGVA